MGWALIPYTVLIRRGETEADTPGEHLAKREAELGVVWPQALPGSRERPTAVRLWLSEETYPAHTWVLDFSPLDCERLHFRFFKPPSVWGFVMTARKPMHAGHWKCICVITRHCSICQSQKATLVEQRIC